MDSGEYTISFYKMLRSHGDKDRAKMQTAYMKNKFAFVGLTMKERRDLQKAFEKEHGSPSGENFRDIVYLLWNIDLRDCQMSALDIMVKSKKYYREEDIKLIEYCITQKSWWDTVDMLASHCAGSWFQKYPERIAEVTGKWMDSGNMWLQRTALLFQLKYKADTDTALLSDYIVRLTSHEDFFIRKAIGWILREYGKTNPEWVVEFVARTPMSDLSRKEALRRIKA